METNTMSAKLRIAETMMAQFIRVGVIYPRCVSALNIETEKEMFSKIDFYAKISYKIAESLISQENKES